MPTSSSHFHNSYPHAHYPSIPLHITNSYIYIAIPLIPVISLHSAIHPTHCLSPIFWPLFIHPRIPFPWFPCMWSFSSMYTHHIQCLSLIFHHHTHLGSSYTHHRLLYYTFNIFLSSPGTWSLSLLTNSLASDAIRGDVYQHRRKRMLDSPSRKVQPCMLLLTWRID